MDLTHCKTYPRAPFGHIWSCQFMMMPDRFRKPKISVSVSYDAPFVLESWAFVWIKGMWRTLCMTKLRLKVDRHPWCSLTWGQVGTLLITSWFSGYWESVEIRKSSCVNARGIPPAVQQVFAVLICPGGGTYPGWERGTCHDKGSNYHGRVGVPTLAGEYLPWLWGTYPGRGVPILARGTYQGRYPPSGPGQGRQPPPPPPTPRSGPCRGRVGTPRCGQTNKLKLLPSPIIRMRSVIILLNLFKLAKAAYHTDYMYSQQYPTYKFYLCSQWSTSRLLIWSC